MVAGCTLEMASSSARNLMTHPANVSDQPEKVCGVRAIGERIWHEEEWQYRIHL